MSKDPDHLGPAGTFVVFFLGVLGLGAAIYVITEPLNLDAGKHWVATIGGALGLGMVISVAGAGLKAALRK